MYANTNYTTKKAFRTATLGCVAECVIQNDPYAQVPENGTIYVEGPHYPAPHTWYAQVEITAGTITKIK